MAPFLFGLTCLAAALECLGVVRGWRKLEYYAKPAVMVFLLGWLLLAGGLTAGRLSGPLAWFAAGLVFSLFGDGLLLLPDEERWFPFGLGAFLLAHLAYFSGLFSPPPPLGAMTIFVGFMVVVSVLPLIRRILAALRQKGLEALLLPVQAYAAVIALMLFSALLTLFREDWQAGPAYLVSLGAVSFVASDLMLAWGRFIKPLRGGALLVMVTYYLGQILLVLGALGQFAAGG